MRRLLAAALPIAALLGAAPVAGAVTIDEDTTINCSTGQAPDGFNWDSGQKAFTIKGGLAVTSGATLSATHEAANPERCRLIVETGRVIINGTVDYDQRGDMEKGGPLELIAREQIEIDGEVASDGAAGVSPSAIPGGDGTSGGDAGSVLVRGPVVVIEGTVTADGGNGGDGAAIPLIGSANGGNGGDAGSATVISDFGALTLSGSITALPGSGGDNAGSGTTGDAGANIGLVRRNALAFAGNGQFSAATRRTNGPPTNLRSTTQPVPGVNLALTWTDNSDEESGFVITKSTGSGPFQAIGGVAPNVRSFTDPTPTAAGQTYRYLVIPAFPAEVWPQALVASNLLTATIGGATSTPNPGVGTTPPATFSVNRFSPLRSSYSLPRGRRSLRLRLRSYGTGRLRVSVRVRTSRGNRTARRELSIRRGINSFALTLPVGWRPGRYTLRLTTISRAGGTKSVTKRISLRYRR